PMSKVKAGGRSADFGPWTLDIGLTYVSFRTLALSTARLPADNHYRDTDSLYWFVSTSPARQKIARRNLVNRLHLSNRHPCLAVALRATPEGFILNRRGNVRARRRVHALLVGVWENG